MRTSGTSLHHQLSLLERQGNSTGVLDADKTESDFVGRVHAIKAGGKLTDGMTEEEMAYAYVAADRDLRGASNDT